MKFFVTFAALIAVATANPLNTWSLADLEEAVSNPNTNPSLLPYLQFAHSELMNSIASGLTVDSIVVPTPAVTDEYTVPSSWTVPQLSAALQNPHTNPANVPLMEAALNELLTSLFTGNNVNAVVINLPVENIEIIPIPVFPEPEVPEKPEPVLPEIPTPEYPAVSSPLVQVIVNINGQQQQITEIPHEIVPTPVQFVDDVPADILADLRQR